jgi:predicted metalloprotease
MLSSTMRRAGQAGMALLFSGVAIHSAAAAAPAATPSTGPGTVQVTKADVAESNEEIQNAYGALATMWTKDFEQMGRRFVVPRLFNYRGNVRTSCGIMAANNAAYCPTNNAVYFDEVFVAGQRKLAARQLHTDGDMAGIGVIAHEIGHAAAMQLGFASRVSYDNEAVADCLSGTFIKSLQEDSTLGTLEPGDLEEALFGVAAAGDPAVELTGNERVDNRLLRRRSMMAHGTSEQRVANFKVGMKSGIRGCFPRQGA